MGNLTRLNFSSVNLLLAEQSSFDLEILTQIFFGFGARNYHGATTQEEAAGIAGRHILDLVVLELKLREGSGLDLVRWLRRSSLEQNRAVPIIATSADGASDNVTAARDAGANYFILKPVTPENMIDRVIRVLNDTRPFVEFGAYIGPDRRFKNEGPPPGFSPRRSTDLTGALGDAREPNMSQADVEALFKPQKAHI
jgi:DNA-binding response OmpR family regulator